MKKRAAAVLLAVVAFSCAACGSPQESAPQGNAPRETAEDSSPETEELRRRIEELEEENRLLTEGASRLPADFTAEASGYCGADLTWEYGNGVLYIHGTGEMTDYAPEDHIAPWRVDLEGRIARVLIDEGCTSIGDSAFYQCASLSHIEIPDTVTRIGASAFQYCDSLPSIEIPASVNDIGGRAFYSCDKLAEIHIPEGVTKIEYETFHGCSNLKSVTIPASVTKCGSYAFNGCEDLTVEFQGEDIDFNWLSDCGAVHAVLPDAVRSLSIHDHVLGGYTGETTVVAVAVAELQEHSYSLDTVGYYGSITWRGRAYSASEMRDFLNDVLDAGATLRYHDEEYTAATRAELFEVHYYYDYDF